MAVPGFRVVLCAIVLLGIVNSGVVAADKPVTVPVPVKELDNKFELIGRTGQPLFKLVRVEGFVVDGPDKGYEGGPNVRQWGRHPGRCPTSLAWAKVPR